MSIKLIGKSTLGDLGLCLSPHKMGSSFYPQMERVEKEIFSETRKTGTKINRIVMTAMTGSKEIQLLNEDYLPKIRLYEREFATLFDPYKIYKACEKGLDSLQPGADFIVWDSTIDSICVTTFSREAPILAFENNNGVKALGVILRHSLMYYGDYLFETIKNFMGDNITVILVSCNYYPYKNKYGEDISIPTVIKRFAKKYNMDCVLSKNSNSETNPECYHRSENGNHVVAMW